MKNPFLLIAGDYIYDSDGFAGQSRADWIGCYETKNLAESSIKEYSRDYFVIQDKRYDYYDIIDLRDWVFVA